MAGILKATKLRAGNLVIMDGELFRVYSTDHRTPGKGNACIKAKLRSLSSGNMTEKRFNSDDKIERAILESIKMEYLYEDGDFFVFMNTENYEQVNIDNELVGDNKFFILPNSEVNIEFHDGKPVGITLPMNVILKVEETPPFVKKATASAQIKPATLETGYKINVPGFVESGDLIKINTETTEYVARANSYDD